MSTFKKGFELLGIDLGETTAKGMTTCFSCSDKRKQANKNKRVLQVYKETGYYKCHHCGINGQVDSDEWINRDPNQYVAPETKSTLPPVEQKEKPKEVIKPFLMTRPTAKVYELFESRGISQETCEFLKIAANNNKIAFNYYKDGQVVGAKYRAINEKKFYQHAGCEKYLYNLDSLKGQDEIIIVEGEFDVAAIIEAGFKNVGSVSQGAPNAGTHVGSKLQCLDNSIEYIKKAKRVIVFTDEDPNGKYLKKILIERFGADRCATVEIPEGCKDANDVLLRFGVDRLRKIIKAAKDTPIQGVRTVNQARSKMLDQYHNGIKKGIPTGVKALDGIFSFYKGWWYLWHGIPQSGKSAFVNFLMMCMSVQHGWKWAVFSPEHYPEEDFYMDMVEVLTGKTVDNESYHDRVSEQDFEVAMDFINEHFFFVYPEFDNMKNSSEVVLDKIRELKLSKGIDGYLIDPYNQLVREDNDQISVYLERSLSEVDNLNKTHNLVGNIVAHPIKQYKPEGELDYKKSTTYDVAGGAMWYNKSYVSTNVHRPFNQSDKTNKMVEIDVQKVKRQKVVGYGACVDMTFDRVNGWYYSSDGSCPLEGAFEIIRDGELEAKGEKKMTFREAMEAEGKGELYNDVPF